jgi:hypothetical protein
LTPLGAGPHPAAGILAIALSALLGWWAVRDGAYFGTVMLAGGIGMCALVAALAPTIPWRLRWVHSSSALVAAVALAALAAWTALSGLWSPAPDVALADGHRVALYGVLFLAGVVFCNLLGRRMELAFAPIALAGAVAAGFAVAGLLASEPAAVLETDGTLQYPLGYRNANAAFFAIAFFAALSVAASQVPRPAARAGALGAASLCGALLVLCQSRGSIPAFALAAVVWLILHPERLRATAWITLGSAPALAALPAAADLFASVDSGDLSGAAGEAERAAVVALAIGLAGVVAGYVVARAEPHLPGFDGSARNNLVARGLAVLAVVCGGAFVLLQGNPAAWIGDRAEEFRDAGTPSFEGESTRFTLNAGSNRYDLWRVGVAEFSDRPLTGGGAGSFRYAYLREREIAHQTPRDAHSIQVEHLAELGLPGLALLATALAGATIAALRSRRLGPGAAATAAGGLAIGAYWFTHSSIDWFWTYPALTGAAMVALGAAAAPRLFDPAPVAPSPKTRWAVVAVAAAGAATMVPPLLSEKLVERAREGWRAEPQGALLDLDRAGRLNPLSDVPSLTEGAIAHAIGDTDRAIEAFEDAVRKRPEEWAGHLYLARLLAGRDPARALELAREAATLNPHSAEAQSLTAGLAEEAAGPS